MWFVFFKASNTYSIDLENYIGTVLLIFIYLSEFPLYYVTNIKDVGFKPIFYSTMLIRIQKNHTANGK